MKGYLGKTYCLYLDQFAISNIVEDNAQWIKIKQLIEKGVAQNVLVCPMSAEHFLETAGKKEAGAIDHNDYFKKISGCLLLKPHAFITAQLLISSIRKNNITKNTFLNKPNPAYIYKDSLQKLRDTVSDFKGMIEEATTVSNEIRAAARDKKIESKMHESLMATTKAISLKEFTDRLQELLKTGGITIQGVKFEKREVPFWADYIIDILIKKHKMNTLEGIKLLTKLNKEGFSGISTLEVRSTLVGYMAVLQKKQTANDEIDLGRIASAMQLSDCMVIDGARKSEIIATGLDKKYGTKILSGKSDDVIELEKLLATIVPGRHAD